MFTRVTEIVYVYYCNYQFNYDIWHMHSVGWLGEPEIKQGNMGIHAVHWVPVLLIYKELVNNSKFEHGTYKKDTFLHNYFDKVALITGHQTLFMHPTFLASLLRS